MLKEFRFQSHRHVSILVLRSTSLYLTTSNSSRSTIIPILAQRLLLNMRKVTYVGSQPAASKLLFAALEQRPHDDFGSHGEDSELTAENGVTEAIH